MTVFAQAIQVETSFFHFSLQGLMLIGTIAVGIGTIIRYLRKLDRGFTQFQWEHNVMWYHWQRHNQVPAYPHLEAQDRRNKQHSDKAI